MVGKKYFLLNILFVFWFSSLWAQSSIDSTNQNLLEQLKPGNTSFLLRGYSHAGFESVDNQSTFTIGSFNPILLWRHGERFIFESEMEIAYEEGTLDFNLEYADLSYILNKYLIVRAGHILSPFGTFTERLHPAWINRLTTKPLGLGHHEPVGPTNEVGVELRGGAPAGNTKINYSAYLSNGPALDIESDLTVVPVIAINYTNYVDNNNNKAIGGRFGLLPFNNSMLELGLSGQYAKIGDRDTEFADVASVSYAADLSLVKNSITAIKGNIDVKGQWNWVNTDEFRVLMLDGDTETFNLDKDAYYIQLAYRPALVQDKFLSNIEGVIRYSGIKVPAEVGHGAEGGHMEEGLEGDRTQWAFGINYWLSWRSVLKCSFQTESNSNDTINSFYIHYAFGF